MYDLSGEIAPNNILPPGKNVRILDTMLELPSGLVYAIFSREVPLRRARIKSCLSNLYAASTDSFDEND